MDHIDHTDHIDHIDHIERIEHVDHLDNVDHVDHMDRIDHVFIDAMSVGMICCAGSAAQSHPRKQFSIATNRPSR